jgi:hypothetical protein
LKTVECTGYGVRLSPWQCLWNQLSVFCLPGFPCETCEKAVSIRTAGGAPAPLEGEEIEAEVGPVCQDPAVMMSSYSDPGGAPALNSPKPRAKRLPAWWKNASKAVQRDWLREREGRQ